MIPVAESKLAALSMDFAVKVLRLCDSIKGHYSLVNQLERSATSIGANIPHDVRLRAHGANITSFRSASGDTSSAAKGGDITLSFLIRIHSQTRKYIFFVPHRQSRTVSRPGLSYDCRSFAFSNRMEEKCSEVSNHYYFCIVNRKAL